MQAHTCPTASILKVDYEGERRQKEKGKKKKKANWS